MRMWEWVSACARVCLRKFVEEQRSNDFSSLIRGMLMCMENLLVRTAAAAAVTSATTTSEKPEDASASHTLLSKRMSIHLSLSDGNMRTYPTRKRNQNKLLHPSNSFAIIFLNSLSARVCACSQIFFSFLLESGRIGS